MLNFAGCAVVISHDRWFLDRIATHILAFEGDSYVDWCEGNFQTYEDQRTDDWGSTPTSRTGSATRRSPGPDGLDSVGEILGAGERAGPWCTPRRGWMSLGRVMSSG